MWRTVPLMGSLIAVCIGLSASPVPASDIIYQSHKQAPIAFTKNIGQWDEQVLFRAGAGGSTMWFTREGITYQFIRPIKEHSARSWAGTEPGLPGKAMAPDSIEQLVITARFVGANPDPEVVGEGPLKYKCNYLLGNDPTLWRTGAPNYEAITFRDVYPDIDLRYYRNSGGQIEYDFIVHPESDPSLIAFHFDGAQAACIDDEGRLEVDIEWGTVLEHRPLMYQICGGERSMVFGEYMMLEDSSFGFLAGGYDKQLALVIDPILSYSTYLGGEANDWTEYWNQGGIAMDDSACIFLTGCTVSADFPLQNPYQTYQTNRDIYVTKLSADGSSLVYSTYLGGSSTESSAGIAVDRSGHAYLSGRTLSSDFPVVNPFQTHQGGYDAFVAKLNVAGDGLVYSTYLGGSDDDEWGYDVAVDSSSNLYVTGYTKSDNFPTINAFQGTFQGGNEDAFVAKLSVDGNALDYSTYLGGSGSDGALGIAVDLSGNVYLTGQTGSPNFPTKNPYQLGQGTYDVFVTKLNSLGDSLEYSTYLGGTNSDGGVDIAIDDGGFVYVTGLTLSDDFPTQNPFQGSYHGTGYYDVFVTKLSRNGDTLVYSTYLGGSDTDVGTGVAVDGLGRAYVSGWTSSWDFPVLNSLQPRGGDEAFVTCLEPSGDTLLYSTYLGGSRGDYLEAIAVEAEGNAYALGWTISTDFPTRSPYQLDQGGWDAVVVKLSHGTCGDADGSGAISISDAVYLINYIFAGGPAPHPLLAGDADFSGLVTISDAVYLINYIFAGGPAPCAAFM